jgi:hypothetical protein
MTGKERFLVKESMKVMMHFLKEKSFNDLVEDNKYNESELLDELAEMSVDVVDTVQSIIVNRA